MIENFFYDTKNEMWNTILIYSLLIIKILFTVKRDLPLDRVNVSPCVNAVQCCKPCWNNISRRGKEPIIVKIK